MAELPEPICRSPNAVALATDSKQPHLGLLFERFPRVLEASRTGYTMRGKRDAWLAEFLRRSRASSPILERYHRRLDELCHLWGGERRVFRTMGRLAIGLGNPNAGDIGFSLDHATGLPVIPGSSIKGLARAAARALGDMEHAERILGKGRPPGRHNKGQVGTVIFLDALVETWPPSGRGFEIDVMTRHHDPAKLRQQKTPLDADEPNPVHFLVLGEGVRFVFRLLPLPHMEKSNDHIQRAWRWLEFALSQLGAGGKTAVGYGEMIPVQDQKAEPER